MEFKKAICHLWGHEFVAVPAAFSQQNESMEYICSRCGREKFTATGTWEEFKNAPEMNVDLNFVQNRSEIVSNFR